MLRLKEVREDHGYSQEALAYKAGVAVKTVFRAEKLGSANSETVAKLARAIGVPIDELYIPDPKEEAIA